MPPLRLYPVLTVSSQNLAKSIVSELCGAVLVAAGVVDVPVVTEPLVIGDTGPFVTVEGAGPLDMDPPPQAISPQTQSAMKINLERILFLSRLSHIQS